MNVFKALGFDPHTMQCSQPVGGPSPPQEAVVFLYKLSSTISQLLQAFSRYLVQSGRCCPSFLPQLFFFGPLPCLNLSSAKFGLRVKRFQEMAALVGGPGLWPSSQRVKCHFSWYSCLKRQCFTCWIRFAHWLKRPDDTLHIVLTHPWLWNSVLVLVRLIYWTVKITFPTRQQQASH